MTSRDAALRDAREDHRNEAAGNRRRDDATKAAADAKAERRLQALLPTLTDAVEEFGTWVVL